MAWDYKDGQWVEIVGGMIALAGYIFAIHFGITSLEIKKGELIERILKYGQSAGLYYTKHY